MKCIIFCGGYGTRYNKNDKRKILKPLVKIKGISIIKRIINIYSKAGIKDFILLGGYKIKDLKSFAKKIKGLNIRVLDTGLGTETGGRLSMVKSLIKKENFFLTYGDSLTSFNPKKCLNFKKKIKKNYIVSTHKLTLPYGVFKMNNDLKITKTYEKNFNIFINAGFYLLDERVFKYIKSKNDSFEKNVIPRIIKNGKIKFYGFKLNFWHPVDTKKDRFNLSQMI
tara:strand:+ start:1816 stop:2487 length:672 start_codon:yes stop_codon:yes gene_type:complete